MAIYVGDKRYAPYVGSTRRKVAKKEGEKPLPQGGVRLEYIRFTGTQYIDTGFIPDNNSSIELVLTPNERDTYICGSGISYNSRAFEMYTYSNYNVEVNYGNNYKTDALRYTSGVKYKIVLDKNVAKAYSLQGELLYSHTFNGQSFTCPSTLFLGALHRGASGGTILVNTKTFDLGNVVIKDNGTVIRDYIPARIGQVGYLYDLTSQQYYGNESATDFVLGPDI